MSGHVLNKSLGVLRRIFHFSVFNRSTERHPGTEMDGPASPEWTVVLLLPHTAGGLARATGSDVGTVNETRRCERALTQGGMNDGGETRSPYVGWQLWRVLQTNALIVVLL